MKNLPLLCCLMTVCLGRPQEELSGRIVFDSASEEFGEDCGPGEVSFQGACYWRGERGPCKQGQVIWIDNKFPDPHCIPFVPGMEVARPSGETTSGNKIEVLGKQSEEIDITKLTKGSESSTDTTMLPILPKLPILPESNLAEDNTKPNEEVISNPETNVELSVESLIEESKPVNDSVCHQQGKILWHRDGSCHSLLTQGPCPARQWLQVVSTSPHLVVECVARPCQGEDKVWWPGTCQCVARSGQEAGQVCGEGAELLWSPYGEGVCACAQDPPHEAAEDGACHELGGRGPCEDGFLWKKGENGGGARCVDGNAFKPRIFDLIPFNHGRFANMRNCHVDSRGRCRRRIRFNRRGRRQAGDDGNTDFLDWLAGFSNFTKPSCL